jgi:hypothetical protein
MLQTRKENGGWIESLTRETGAATDSIGAFRTGLGCAYYSPGGCRRLVGVEALAGEAAAARPWATIGTVSLR